MITQEVLSEIIRDKKEIIKIYGEEFYNNISKEQYMQNTKIN